MGGAEHSPWTADGGLRDIVDSTAGRTRVEEVRVPGLEDGHGEGLRDGRR